MRILIFFICLFCAAPFLAGEDKTATATPERADNRSDLEKLKSKDPEVRWKACVALGKEFRKGSAASENIEKKKRIVNALKRALKDKNPGVRRFAGRSLDLIMKSESVTDIRNVLREEDNRGVKIEFIKILGKHKDEASRDLLHELLADKDLMVRSESIYALGKLDFQDSHEKIVSMLDDKAEGVRVAAAETAALLKITGASGKIEDLLGDANAEVRLRAAEALKAVGEKKQIKKLKKYRSKEEDAAVRKKLDELIKKLKEDKKK